MIESLEKIQNSIWQEVKIKKNILNPLKTKRDYMFHN